MYAVLVERLKNSIGMEEKKQTMSAIISKRKKLKILGLSLIATGRGKDFIR